MKKIAFFLALLPALALASGPAQVCDYTGTNCVDVKAASTASAATDRSLVVQLNPAQPALTNTLKVSLAQTVNTSPVPSGATAFSCQQSAITATTLCQAAQGAGVKLYVTDVWISNGSTTASAISLIYADAGACTGTPTQVTPPTTLASNAGAGSFTVYSFTTPIALPANKALCCKTGGSTAFSCLVSGFYGP